MAEKEDRARHGNAAVHGSERGGQGRRCGGEEGSDGIIRRNDRLDRPGSRRCDRRRDRGGWWRRFKLFTGLQSITEPSPQGSSLRSRSSLVVAVFLLLALPLPFLVASAARAAPPEDNPAVPAILARAESLFQSMKARDYTAIFAALSAKSRETIVAETSSALAAAAKQVRPMAPPPDPGAVRDDFVAGGPIARD